jgi:hypothetical protein
MLTYARQPDRSHNITTPSTVAQCFETTKAERLEFGNTS